MRAGSQEKTMTNIQNIIDRAVAIATDKAIGGCPVERIIWIPPEKATDNYDGCFAVQVGNRINIQQKGGIKKHK